jgi:hypothetical protein
VNVSQVTTGSHPLKTAEGDNEGDSVVGFGVGLLVGRGLGNGVGLTVGRGVGFGVGLGVGQGPQKPWPPSRKLCKLVLEAQIVVGLAILVLQKKTPTPDEPQGTTGSQLSSCPEGCAVAAGTVGKGVGAGDGGGTGSLDGPLLGAGLGHSPQVTPRAKAN